MVTIKIRDNESFDLALRRFKRLCEKSGILSDIKKHEFYEKPSEKRKRIKSLFIKKRCKKKNNFFYKKK